MTTMEWMKELKGETKEEKVESYLAWVLGPYCPSEEDLKIMAKNIMQIVA